jgi:hypothetical protein
MMTTFRRRTASRHRCPDRADQLTSYREEEALDNGRLNDVLLGNNPRPTAQTAWSKLSHREYDLLTWDYGHGSWSLGCNAGRIGPGTVGWIYRSDGSYGHLAGLIIFMGLSKQYSEPGGPVNYCDGWLWRLPREWWIDGARVRVDKRWSGRAPFGDVRRFRNGEYLKSHDREVLWDLLHPVAREWIEDKVRNLRSAS